ncbi:MAG: lipid biosynthesis B12-binding/radical SAM protein [Thermodesulfobacteriota bacterium]|nr:lipid biosynthesis B12-binding/radical SAM protein [Thermodesulfobacteriota bacterium]
MKVLLVSANIFIEPYPVYPLGLDYVTESIADSHQVKISDLNDLKDLDSIKEVIRNFLPDIIGISIRNIDNTDTADPKGFIGHYKKLVALIRGCSKSPIVLGGSGFTIFPAEVLEALQADYGIVGEGERFSLLLNAIEKREDVSSIPGVITRGNKAQIPKPLDQPFSARIDTNNSHLNFYLKKGGMLNLQTKRGCNFQCIYCTYPHIEGSKLRLIPPKEVANTALKLQEAGAEYFSITDSAFNSDFSHSAEVARAFIKYGVSIPWGAFFAPKTPPKDYYKLMADAGLTHVEFGTEAMSNKMLASYRKPFKIDNVFEAHKLANDAGLYVAHFFLLGGPGENRESLEETLSNVDKLDKTVLFFFCGLRIYPYTALYDIALSEGQISGEQNLLKPVFYQSRALSSEEIINRVSRYANGRMNWVIGAGGEQTAKITSRMYDHGHYGPLWEHLIQ